MPRKQPNSLLNLSVRNCVSLINSACYVISKSYPENMFTESEKQASLLKRYLMSLLPVRLFDFLCSERTCCQYRGDPRLQLHVLTHPNMSVFRKCDIDNAIPQHFWVEILADFHRITVLDLEFICTDEILKVIGMNCPLLKEINIVSRVDICKSLSNASVLIRNVSDAGLCSIANLKELRILEMDSPRNERANRVGRCVSQSGIIMLVSELPYLEELIIKSRDIESTELIGTPMEIGPLSLRKIKCHFASPEGIKKLLQICPFLKELSVKHVSEHNKDAIIEQIAVSDLRLNKLDLAYFSYTETMHRLLYVKGCYLTCFALWEIDYALTMDAVIWIGECCPNLNNLCIMTESVSLVIPRYFRRPKNIFSNLRWLTLGSANFNIDHILLFFFDCTQKLEGSLIKFQSNRNFDDLLLCLLEKDSFKYIRILWLDCTLKVSKDVAMRVIRTCEHLRLLFIVFEEQQQTSDVQKYIADNNLDLKFCSY